MQYRVNQKNGDKISALGYGGMRFPTVSGKINEPLAKKQLLLAIDNGLNYIDTAYPYHKGQSETFIGQVLKETGYREKVKLATKMPHWILKTEQDFYKMLDVQLNKLQTDRIDYYLLHMISNYEAWTRLKAMNIGKFIDYAKESGKIVNIGFSSHTDQLDFKKVLDDYPWDFCQIQFNLLDENYQAGLGGLNYAGEKGIPVIVMEPLKGGMLAKTIPDEVKKLYGTYDKTNSPAAWALKWVWNHPQVTCVLSGMNDEAQIAENIHLTDEALPNHLSQSDLELLDKVKAVYKAQIKIPCTGCRYCMPCPFGVNIPGVFELYNNKFIYPKSRLPQMEYTFRLGGVMGTKAWASLCKECGRCERECPQHIEIRKELKKVKKTFEGPFSPVLVGASKPVIRLARFFTAMHVKHSAKKYAKKQEE